MQFLFIFKENQQFILYLSFSSSEYFSFNIINEAQQFDVFFLYFISYLNMALEWREGKADVLFRFSFRLPGRHVELGSVEVSLLLNEGT